MASIRPSYIIIGAGVFGVSTAYHLIKKYPDSSVTLVDRDAFDAEQRVAASWDWNKVVRADYDDPVYCRLGLEAQDVFESDPLWKPYFHKTGLYWMCRSDGYAQAVLDNYKALGRDKDVSLVSVNEARKMFGGLFEDADYTDVSEVLVNKNSGWAAAGDCLQAITRKTLELGANYVTAEVTTLEFRENRCCGVRIATGEILTASHIIICAGAFTPKLLEMSAGRSGLTDLRAGTRIVAGGITTGMTRLDDDSYERFAAMPVGIQGYTASAGPFIGSLPPTKDKELKWWGQTIFKNTREILPGRYISMPPPERDYAQWDVSGRLKEDISFANNVFYGRRGAKWKMEKHRICWDAFTTSSDFIISPHSASKGLYLATCGSFHGWKFFPVLGKYVLEMLEGSLSPLLSEKWDWDRERPDPSLNADWPRSEMKDLRKAVFSARL